MEDKKSISVSNVDSNEAKSNENSEKNSKFYVDCSDVDTTVTFPFKLMTAIDDRNVSSSETVEDHLKRSMNSPIATWPRPLKVQSFFSNLPLDPELYASRVSDEQQASDINDNPFSRGYRPSSTTFFDYPNSTLVAENKNRKAKRSKNAAKKGVLAENIEGHRGKEDIESLLKFINSSDKKSKNVVKGTSPNQVMSSNKNDYK